MRVDYHYAIMHDTFVLVDGATVEIGRFNFTAATESHNGENVLVVHCPAVATRYGAGIGPVVGGVARPQGLRLTEQGA